MDFHKPDLLGFLGRISHELRTPLNCLLILSHRLAENEEQNLTQRQLEFAQTIEQSGSELLHLIEEILDLARIEAKSLPIDRGWIEISEVMANLVRTFGDQAEQKKLRFLIEIDPAVPSAIESDPRRLLQVMRNLVSNAIKFTDAGEVCVSIEVLGEKVCFAVRDTGVGIPLEEQAKVFDAFRQGHRRAPHEGAGLGLTISKMLTELLQGELTLESAVGRGSTFRLLVPRRLDAFKHRLAPRRLRTEPKSSVVLAIDRAAEELARAPKAADLELAIASTGEKGLRMARELQPKGILMNTSQPDLDGWILLDVLKRDPRTRHLPLLAICNAKDGRRARQLGAFDHAPPPRTSDELREMVKSVLSFSERSQRTVLAIGGAPLEWTGIDFGRATTGRDGLAAIAAYRPDCIVITPSFHDMSPLELVDRIKREHQARPIPLIINVDGTPDTHLGSLGALADVMIPSDELAPLHLTDAIARILHLKEDALPPERRTHLEQLRLKDPSLSGRQLMIVDDDVYSIFALTSVLERHSMQVSFCESGQEALAALGMRSVDAVLMDILMPAMDGFDTIQKIRTGAASASVPIIAVTARAMPGDREACLSAGADDYVPKPVDVDRLLGHLRNRLSASPQTVPAREARQAGERSEEFTDG